MVSGNTIQRQSISTALRLIRADLDLKKLKPHSNSCRNPPEPELHTPSCKNRISIRYHIDFEVRRSLCPVMTSTDPPTTPQRPRSPDDGLHYSTPDGPRRSKTIKRMRAVARFVANPVAETRKNIEMKAARKTKAEAERLAEWDRFLQSGRNSHEAGQNWPGVW